MQPNMQFNSMAAVMERSAGGECSSLSQNEGFGQFTKSHNTETFTNAYGISAEKSNEISYATKHHENNEKSKKKDKL